MRTLGLDISSKNTGWSILDDTVLVDFGEFGSDKPSTDKNAHADRLLRFTLLIEEIIAKYTPDVIVIEDAWAGKNISTLKILCFYHGIVHMLAAKHNIKENIFMPSRFRRLVGITYNTKLNYQDRELGKTAAIEFAYSNFEKLKEASASEDTCESAIIALAHYCWHTQYLHFLEEVKLKNAKIRSVTKLHDLATKATEKYFEGKAKQNEKSL